MPILIRAWKTISKFSNGHGNISEMKDLLYLNSISGVQKRLTSYGVE
jgi:hypothetical protein